MQGRPALPLGLYCDEKLKRIVTSAVRSGNDAVQLDSSMQGISGDSGAEGRLRKSGNSRQSPTPHHSLLRL